MNTTDTYIRMCKHPKIQEGWQPEVGDWYCRVKLPSTLESTWTVHLVRDTSFKAHYLDWKNHPEIETCLELYQETTWLPTQDQIQEMLDIENVNDYYEAIFDMFFEGGYEIEHSQPLWRFLNLERPSTEYEERFSTPEQLWLAFYMDVEHNLIWDEDKWIKI